MASAEIIICPSGASSTEACESQLNQGRQVDIKAVDTGLGHVILNYRGNVALADRPWVGMDCSGAGTNMSSDHGEEVR